MVNAPPPTKVPLSPLSLLSELARCHSYLFIASQALEIFRSQPSSLIRNNSVIKSVLGVMQPF